MFEDHRCDHTALSNASEESDIWKDWLHTSKGTPRRRQSRYSIGRIFAGNPARPGATRQVFAVVRLARNQPFEFLKFIREQIGSYIATSRKTC